MTRGSQQAEEDAASCTLRREGRAQLHEGTTSTAEAETSRGDGVGGQQANCEGTEAARVDAVTTSNCCCQCC